MGIYKFNSDDVFAFGSAMHQKTKIKGNELQFYDCPYCHGSKHGDKYTFSINVKTGQFKCLRAKCGATGNMITLSRDFDFSLGAEVDEYIKPKKQYRSFVKPTAPIQPKDSTIEYLSSRGISPDVAKKYEITTKNEQKNVLVFPFYDEKGNLCFFKYRKTDFVKGKDKCKEWCEAGCKPILFGMKQCNLENSTLIITEGQLDSLSVATAGFENAVSVPNGAKGFTWIPYCYNWVSKFETIIVFGDYENGHMTLLEDMIKRFPVSIRQVREEDYKDCKDANELLMKYGTDAINNAISNATPIAVDKIMSLASVEDKNYYNITKLKTGIKDLDGVLYGGLPFGMVTIIAGKRGDGKSTFASQVMAQALEQGYNTLAYSGELPNYLFKGWLDFQIAGRHHIVENSLIDGRTERFITKQNQALINSWYSNRAYIYDNRIVDDDESEDLLNTIEKAIQQYDIKVILIDNLMTAMYLDEDKSSDKYDQQGRFVRKLTRIAMQYDCLVILVAHQRKTVKGFTVSDVNDEISGSGDISNLAGIVLSYNRGSDKEIDDGYMEESQRKLILAKNRLFGKLDLKGIILNYDERSKRIYGDNDDVDYEYAWNIDDDGFYDADDIPF